MIRAMIGRVMMGILFGVVASTVLGAPLEKSIVAVTAYQQVPDYDSPWRQRPVRRETHFGTLVSGGLILVTADAVRYAKMVEFTRFGDSERRPLQVVFADEAADLAVLRPQNRDALQGMTPLPLGGNLKEGEAVDLVTDQASIKLLKTQATVKEVGIDGVGSLPFGLTHYTLELRQSRGFGRSEPLVKEGQLMGLVVTQRSGEVLALPTRVLRHFLLDVQGRGKYRGFVRLGISVQDLDSATLREYLGAKGSRDGVLVTEVFTGSPFYKKLLPLDILIKVGDAKIDDKARYVTADWGPMHFIDMLLDFHGGDLLSLKVLRQGKSMTLSARLHRYHPEDDVIPGYREGGEKHLVVGGLLFQELSLGYLQTWGANWFKEAPVDFLKAWSFDNNPEKKGERLVILNQVYADTFNKGYEKYTNLILDTVNQSPVKSLDELSRWLEKHGRETWVFRFKGDGKTIVVGGKGLADAQKRIAEKYNIPKASLFGPVSP